MMKTFKMEWKRILYHPFFVLSIVAMAILCLLSKIENIMFLYGTDSGFHNQIFLESLSSSTVLFAIPILCTFPATTSILDDFNSGFIKQYLPRTTRKSYIIGKITSSITAGGSVLVLGAFLAWIGFLLLSIPNRIALESSGTQPNYLPQLLSTFGLLFLNGSLWSIWGMFLASITKSRYMAYSGSFVTYYLLIILHERYFKDIFLLYPKEWLTPTMEWHLGGMSLPLLLISLIILVSFAFCIYAERRLSNV